jgi:hypothetical protein
MRRERLVMMMMVVVMVMLHKIVLVAVCVAVAVLTIEPDVAHLLVEVSGRILVVERVFLAVLRPVVPTTTVVHVLGDGFKKRCEVVPEVCDPLAGENAEGVSLARIKLLEKHRPRKTNEQSVSATTVSLAD